MKLPALNVWKPASWAAVQRVIAVVERIGGRGLPENCNPATVAFSLTDEQRKEFPRAPGEMAPARTTGCGLRARIALPYTNPHGTESFVRACVVDDAVELWPRVARELS